VRAGLPRAVCGRVEVTTVMGETSCPSAAVTPVARNGGFANWSSLAMLVSNWWSARSPNLTVVSVDALRSFLEGEHQTYEHQ
jgi:hypothetical protein